MYIYFKLRFKIIIIGLAIPNLINFCKHTPLKLAVNLVFLVQKMVINASIKAFWYIL